MQAKSMLLRNARWIRKFLPRHAEYKIRDLMLALSPVKYRSSATRVIHACTWKSASQWVRIILSDPIIYKYSGLRPLVPSTADEMAGLMNVANSDSDSPFRSGRILTPAYVSWSQVNECLTDASDRAFFVSRDPRDLLISRYYSRASAHPSNKKIDQWRRLLSGLSMEDGLIHVMDDFDDIANILRSWSQSASADPRFLITSYEGLTGSARHATWQRLMVHLDINIGTKELEALLEQYSFTKMSGGRDAGDEMTSHKYRKGAVGDWKNHFTGLVEKRFMDKYEDLVVNFGV